MDFLLCQKENFLAIKTLFSLTMIVFLILMILMSDSGGDILRKN